MSTARKFFQVPGRFEMHRGGVLERPVVAYETWGQLNAERDNAVLIAEAPSGRILAAVGRAGLRDLDIRGVRIWLDDVRIVSGGGRDAGYTEAAGKAVVAKPEFAIRAALGRGATATRVLTCDLSFDYVKINAEYRT